MSEIKRRTRKEKPAEPQAPKPPRRERVTLTKDVSSRYRRIEPRPQADRRPGGRKTSGGPLTDREAPARPWKGEDREAPARPRKREDREAPARPWKREGSPAAGRPERRAPGRPGTRAGEVRPFAAREARPPFKRPDPSEAMKALVNRELPEARKQLRETQELLRKVADQMLARLEELSESETGRNGEAIADLLAKMSFQDLAGQRLAKVDGFLAALENFVKTLPAQAPKRDYSSGRAPARPRRTVSDAREDKKRPGGGPARRGASALKGPQADGLGQGEIDSLMADLSL